MTAIIFRRHFDEPLKGLFSERDTMLLTPIKIKIKSSNETLKIFSLLKVEREIAKKLQPT